MMQNKAERVTTKPKKASSKKTNLKNRDKIVAEFLPGIRIQAMRLKMRLPSHIEVDDLISSGVVGLLDALDRYDASRDTKFRTYADFRIRGAMLDYLREMDWFPRSVRKHSSRLQSTYARLENILGRPPEESEVANEIGITVDELNKQLAMFMGVTVFSLDAIQDGDEESGAGIRSMLAEAAKEESREEELTRELKDQLGKAIDMLPEREKQLIALYYGEDLTLREISHILSLGEPRICQLHAQAVLRLKSKLNRHFK
ncbi:MAG: FliA/WhiG family RNA polymerase sigma factor [Syntrophorhabdaceae bacterium]|nr:FliA/WhiG family RNA polymerase sigma factor [Syntrophorhabdaceae bacterium]